MGVALPPLSRDVGAAVAGATPILPPQGAKAASRGRQAMVSAMRVLCKTVRLVENPARAHLQGLVGVGVV